MQFISQPFGEVRLGDFLLSHLADPQWTLFRASIAFVKRSGTQFIRQPLLAFSGRAQVKISVGIDLYGTSSEGLSSLLGATPNGEIFIYRNSGSSTFHPKVYVFKSPQQAEVLVGSGNLTAGGLFTNYEAGLAVSLDLSVTEDAALLETVENVLNMWSQPQEGICYILTTEFLGQLVTAGLVRSEAQIAQMQQVLVNQGPAADASNSSELNETNTMGATAPVLFTPFAVPPPPPIIVAPTIVQIAAPEPDEGETEVAVDAASGPARLLISVLTVDLPVVGSSNEITISKFIRDVQQDFWGWPDQFEGPNEITGQFRRDIRIRYGAQVIAAYLLDFPARKPNGTKASADFRMGSIAPIVADLQQEDDIVILSVSNEPNVNYVAQVVNVGDPEYDTLVDGMQVYGRSRSANGTFRKFRYID